MNTYVIIGAPGTGKSEFPKSMLFDKATGQRRRGFVFDVQNEYGPRTKYPGQTPLNMSDNPQHEYSRYVPKSRFLKEDVKSFMDIAFYKRNTNIVFEESTIFFQGRMEDQVITLLVNRIHTGNSYSFLFHSINSVPPRIMEMCNFIVLHYTNDEATTVGRKYGKLLHPFLELQEKPKGTRKIISL